jgi:phage protein D
MNDSFSDLIRGGTHKRRRVPAKCVIYVNKQRLKSLSAHVLEVTVKLKRNISGTATLVIDTFRDKRGRWLVQDSGLLRPWDEVKICATFGGPEIDVIHGYVREVRQDYPTDMSAARVTVEVQDDLLKLDREQIHDVLSREGEEKSDGELAREFADKVDMKCVTEQDTEGKELSLTPRALHISTTPIKFLRERAEANGYELYTRKEKLYFHTLQLEAAVQPSIKVYAGPDSNCISFSLQHDGHRPDLVRLMREAEADNEKDMSPQEFRPEQKTLGENGLTSQGKALPPFVWTIDRPQGATEAEVVKRAQAKADENQFKIKATGELDGTLYGHVLLPHLPVKVDGIGEAYGGIYYVDEVTHKFTTGEYRQQFTIIRNAINQ